MRSAINRLGSAQGGPRGFRYRRALLAPAIALLPLTAMSVSLEKARTRLDADLAQCTQRFGFEPAAKSNPERALAHGERPWRECAYDGVKKHLVPSSTIPDVYGQLIGEDRILTDRLARGEITRAERRQRLDELIQRIRKIESEKLRAKQQQLSDYMDSELNELTRARHRLDPF